MLSQLPLLLLALLLCVGLLVWKSRGRKRVERAGLTEVDEMDPDVFARFAGGLFARLGFRVERVSDVLIVRRNDASIAVRPWPGAGNTACVEGAMALRDRYGCDGAMAVSNGSFDKAARKVAKAGDVVLWERAALAEALLVADKLAPSGPMAVRTEVA